MAAISGMDFNTYQNDYYTKVNEASTQALQSTLQGVNKDSTDEELMDACKEFEAYFIEQVYKGMEKTIMKSDEDENDYVSTFGDMRIEAYAKAATSQGEGIGLAKQLYESMKRNTIV